MAIVSKEQFRETSGVKSEVIAFPELGDGAELKIRGLTLGDETEIIKAASVHNEKGQFIKIDEQRDKLHTILRGVEEPALTEADIPWLVSMNVSVKDQILYHIHRLSGRTPDAFAQLKLMLAQNPHIARIYRICRTQFGRLPSEMSDISELEFMTACADIEHEFEEMKSGSGEPE